MSPKGIQRATGADYGYVRKQLSALKREKVVTQPDRGLYTLANQAQPATHNTSRPDVPTDASSAAQRPIPLITPERDRASELPSVPTPDNAPAYAPHVVVAALYDDRGRHFADRVVATVQYFTPYRVQVSADGAEKPLSTSAHDRLAEAGRSESVSSPAGRAASGTPAPASSPA